MSSYHFLTLCTFLGWSGWTLSYHAYRAVRWIYTYRQEDPLQKRLTLQQKQITCLQNDIEMLQVYHEPWIALTSDQGEKEREPDASCIL